jgi:excisionase family DNA binding protein
MDTEQKAVVLPQVVVDGLTTVASTYASAGVIPPQAIDHIREILTGGQGLARLSRKDVAKELNVTVRTVDRMVKRGLLTPVRVTGLGSIRFRASDVARLQGGTAP